MQSIQIGLTKEHPCSYLDGQKERVAVAIDPKMQTAENYEILLANGFRRSGATIYKPYCKHCSQCQALRVDVMNFIPSRSQRRVINKSRHLRFELKDRLDSEWFSLYADYIAKRHNTGSMYPPDKKEFEHFASCPWLQVNYLHIYDEDKLIAIAVMDVLPDCASAFYTFFDPENSLSLGTVAAIFQIEYCKLAQKQWLYLGYQIDSCPAMNYKVRFHPHQRLVNQLWRG
ncbi:arginyltransferase [Vibrio salinus]|uniref:arginyltransferase n=1 Tax=Vibrio salinus TaxID=2899784 RepID=UPI001E53FC6D|nr:arginyltransferase [Vibrio salinus]MCE0496265.1 arginyltransferase [Vibrio salinus]